MNPNNIGKALGGIGIFLMLTQFMLRVFLTGAQETGLQFLLSGLIWAGAACYFAGAALADDRTLRLSGLEIPLLGFAMFCAVSTNSASYRLAALTVSVAWISQALFFFVMFDWISKNGAAKAWTLLSSMGFILILYAVLQVIYFFPMLIAEMKPGVTFEGVRPEMHAELVARLQSREPYATFTLSNTFAGFIAIVLPMMLGSMLDARRHAGGPNPKGAYWMSPDAVVRGMFVVGAGAALYWTGSKGGWVATAAGLAALATFRFCRARGVPGRAIAASIGMLIVLILKVIEGGKGTGPAAVGAAALGIFWVWGWKPLPNRKLAASIGILAIVAFLATFAVDLRGPLRASKSMQFRLDAYWSSARAMIDRAPWRGVGLGNFGDYYPRYRGDLQQETIHAHNDYLEIAAELGIPAAAFFVLIWLAALKRGGGEGADDVATWTRGPATRLELAALAGVAALSIGLAFALRGVFNVSQTPIFAIVLLGVFAAFGLSTHRANEARDADGSPGLVAGAMAGIAAYLVHGFVDFDWYEFGLAETLLLVAALATATGSRPVNVSMPRAASALLAAALAAFALYITAVFAPGPMDGDGLREEAGRALDAAHRASLPLDRQNAYKNAEALIAQAHEKSPMDAEILLTQAQILFEHWSWWVHQPSPTALPSEEMESLAENAQESVTKAQVLRSAGPGPWFFHGLVCLRLAEYNRTLAGMTQPRDQKRDARANSYEQQALQHLGEAVLRYPGRATYRFYLAQAIDMMGNNPSRALDEYRAALRLDALADIKRLKLSDEEVARARERLAP